MNELWLNIDFINWFPGVSYVPKKIYQISNFGAVRSFVSNIDKFSIITPRLKSNGSGKPILIFNIGSGTTKSQIKVSKCVACAFLDPHFDNYFIQHIDDDSSNCRLDNLSLIYQLKINYNFSLFSKTNDILSYVSSVLFFKY